MISMNRLQELSAAELDINGKAGLIDIKAVSVDTALNKPERMTQYINDVYNPYLFKVGDMAVKVRYGKEKHRLQESVANFLATQ